MQLSRFLAAPAINMFGLEVDMGLVDWVVQPLDHAVVLDSGILLAELIYDLSVWRFVDSLQEAHMAFGWEMSERVDCRRFQLE